MMSTVDVKECIMCEAKILYGSNLEECIMDPCMHDNLFIFS